MGGLCWRGLQRQVTPEPLRDVSFVDKADRSPRLWADLAAFMGASREASTKCEAYRNPPEPTTPTAMLLRRLRSPEFGLGGP